MQYVLFDVIINYTEERKSNFIDGNPSLFLLEEQVKNPGFVRIVLDSDAMNRWTRFCNKRPMGPVSLTCFRPKKYLKVFAIPETLF